MAAEGLVAFDQPVSALPCMTMDLSKLLPTIDDACALGDLRARLASSREPVVLGVSDAAKAAVVAALARDADAPLLVVVPKPPQADSLAE